MSKIKSLPFDRMIAALEALAEPTRLRLAALLSEAELTVTELTVILGQSQPRVSRHLKLLVDAGFVERHREGSWAFFKLNENGMTLASTAIAQIDSKDATLGADRARLTETRTARIAQAADYFATQAQDWDQLRSLHIGDARVEAAVKQIIGTKPFSSLLDLGTGTGRMLEVLAPFAIRAVGVDQSPAMLAVARANIEKSGLRNVQLRQGDVYALPVERDAYDLVIVHQVLHYLDDPARALREAARTLTPNGRMVVIDFAPHSEESLREHHAHRRLGFDQHEIEFFMKEAGLETVKYHALLPGRDVDARLTVSIWLAKDQRLQSDVYETISKVA